MLDLELYRSREREAARLLPSWRLARRHAPDLFERAGFPVRLSCLAETRQLIDTMQEGRLEAYQDELGGLTEEDAARLVRACADLVRFQRLHYPNLPAILPLDTLAAMLASFRKMQAIRPGFARVLEIGPGCGYLSLFLRDHPGLARYDLVESCESFYLLQHYVNQFVFGLEFRQGLHPERTDASWPAAPFMAPSIAEDDETARGLRFLPPAPGPARVRQLPWWRLGDLANETYDLVVANANLYELSPEALRDYLALFRRTLAPDGMLFAQCFGFETPERNRDYLFRALAAAGFAPLLIAGGSQPKARSFWQGRTVGGCGFIEEEDTRRFVVSNGVFVTGSHQLFEACRGRFALGFALDCGPAAAFFEPPRPGARRYDRDELAAMTARAMQEPA